jgi:hypothetical protein
MDFSTFLLYGPSMSSGLYDCYSYIPEDLGVLKKNVESLNTDALKLPPNNFDTGKVTDAWKTFDKKADYLKYSLYVIPFAIVPIAFSTAVIPCIKVIITAIALTALGFHRSYQAGLQANAWPEVNSMINEIRRTLLHVSVNQQFEKCAEHLTLLNHDNLEHFMSDFFDEEKNPLVKTQSQMAVVRETDKVFLFYPRLKADYNNFKEQSVDSITTEQMAQNIEIFIKAYITKDATELRNVFPDVIVN